MRTSAAIPANIDTYTGSHTPEITGRILAYRRGEISFHELLGDLGTHDFKDPSHYASHDNADIESADRAEPGTTGELALANDIGLLSDPEYEAIVSAGLRSHGA